jgi:hypothetical protein
MRTVFIVLYSTPHDSDNVVRFHKRAAAQEFARGLKHYDAPATVTEERVPARIADRWGYND